MTFGTRTQACLRDAERKAEDNAKHCETERDEEGFAFEFRLSEISENKYLNKTVKARLTNIVDPAGTNLNNFIESLILAQDERWRRA